MRNIYISIVFVLCLVLTNTAHAQNIFDKTMSKADSLVLNNKHVRADKNFDNMAYVQAIEKYEKLLTKEIGGDTLKSKLATAYYKIGKTEEAEPLFKDVISGTEFTPEDIYYYAQTLKYNEKYTEADEWMTKYREVRGDDKRAEIQYENAPKIFEIVDQERYKVEEVNFNSSHADFGPVVVGEDIVFATARNDERIIRREYAWNETPYLDIYRIKKDAGALASAKLLSTKLSSAYHDGPVCFNSDGSEIYFTRNNYNKYVPKSDAKVIEHIGVVNKAVLKKSEDGVNNLMIMHSKKVGGEWTYPEVLSFNSYEYSCGHPCLSPDNKTMYFASDMPGGFGGSDIYKVEITEDGFGEPVNMGAEINTEGEEMFPFAHSNGNLYFCSNGQLTLGGLDVFIAAQKGDKYVVKNMGYPLNSSKDDFSFFLEEDGVNGYFASNREGGKGDDDIYQFEILDDIKFSQPIKGRLTNKNTGLIIANTPVELCDASGVVIANLITDAEGMISTEVEDITSLVAKINEAEYFPYTETFEITPTTEVMEMALSPRPYWGIYGNVFLLPDMTPVPEVTLKMLAKNGDETSIVSATDGNFKTNLEPETEYDLVFTKKGFFTKRVQYSTVGRDTGYVNVNEFVELELEKAEVGKSIEIMILYDLGKWNIREDAAVELEDMIQFMKDNPDIKIELGSHTDARGSASSNQSLSQKRAQSAVNFMVERGIAKDRMSAKGYGETKLKNRCADGVSCSEEEHQANRRSEVTIVAM
ncbi:OmpA family protein [Labilibacter marinus]|uniref:OmpA family protein n=1 Tax=Labilibacter marinus TaxID=1477105 RepID=UPI00130124D4|nr:OmpA family protein [Labilibacter marinus]